MSYCFALELLEALAKCGIVVVLVLETVCFVIETCFESISMSPIYVSSLLSSLFTVAWYMMLDVWHCPFSGHVAFTQQLQSFTVFSVLLSLFNISYCASHLIFYNKKLRLLYYHPAQLRPALPPPPPPHPPPPLLAYVTV